MDLSRGSVITRKEFFSAHNASPCVIALTMGFRYNVKRQKQQKSRGTSLKVN